MQQTSTLRTLSTETQLSFGAPASVLGGRGGRGGSRRGNQISTAVTRPGAAGRKKARWQPQAIAEGGRIIGAAKEPSRWEPKFCATPCAVPRYSGSTSVTIIAWLIGITPPSATPISMRAASRKAKLAARPVRKEQTQKARVVRISGTFRLPSASDSAPMPKAANDQVSDKE